MSDNVDIFIEDFETDNWETIKTIISDVKTKIIYKDKDNETKVANNYDRFMFLQLFALSMVAIVAPIAEYFITDNVWFLLLIAIDITFMLALNKISVSKWIYALAFLGLFLNQQDYILLIGMINLAILNAMHILWKNHMANNVRKAILGSEDIFVDTWLNNIESIETPGKKYVHRFSLEKHKREIAERQERIRKENEQINYYDEEFKKRFAQYHNPITNEPICTVQGYLEALASQETKEIFTFDKKLNLDELNTLFRNRFSSEDRVINSVADYLWFFDKQQEEIEVVSAPEEIKNQKSMPIDKCEKSKDDYLDDLNSLIGMDTLKQDVKELINLVQMQKYRENNGLKSMPVSLHLVFTGNPGTGKTSVARILANIYREIGILSKGQLVEVDRADLVAGYVGQTAIKTKEKIQEAMGGILFIDEAYTLNKEGNDFGQEAIDTILKAMEDERDKFVVIAAGYPDLMNTFINSNPGLRSRFNKTIYFPDYSSDELYSIFTKFCNDYDYILSDDAADKVRKVIESMERNKGRNFANARDVRNLFERIISNQASRAMNLGDLSDKEMMTIICEDI